MAEHSAVNRVVVGSSPTWGALARVKGIFLSLGWKRENPPRERLGAGDAAAFSYDIGLFRGFQRAMETDEVCGRPLDSFAFTSHVTMGKKGRGGTDDR